jgi:hypothetical protein
MKKILILILLFLSNCASINKFTYDTCYKQIEIRHIGGDPFYWDKSLCKWYNLEDAYNYSISKSHTNRTYSDIWNIEMYNRYNTKFQTLLEKTK